MTQSLSSFSTPYSVSITSYNTQTEWGRKLTVSDTISADEINAVSILYGVTYLLESTPYTNTEDLTSALTVVANMISSGNLFLYNLKALNIPALNGVTETSAGSTPPAAGSVIIQKSAAPSATPTLSPGIDLDTVLYNGSLKTKLIVGLVVGILSLTFLALFTSHYVEHHTAFNATYGAYFTKLSSYVALVTAGVALVLVVVWATDSDTDHDKLYLGTPTWATNVFAYHPVLMVGGFFAAQVLAINEWSLIIGNEAGKGAHVLTMSAALSCLIAALCAIVKYKVDQKTPSLNTMHSWVGVVSVAVFSANYALGLFMGLLTAFYPGSAFRKAFNLGVVHRVLGLTSLGLSCVAILTGVMDQMPNGACFYYYGGAPQVDWDPAENWGEVKGSCQIAHGMGIAVLVASIATVLAVSIRAEKSYTKVANQQDVVEDEEPPLSPPAAAAADLKKKTSHEVVSSSDDLERSQFQQSATV